MALLDVLVTPWVMIGVSLFVIALLAAHKRRTVRIRKGDLEVRLRHRAARRAERLTVRDHHARVVVQPRSIVKLTAGTQSSFRRFLIADNGLNLLSSPTDAVAAEAYRRVAKAHVAIDPTRPGPHRRGRIVYWWDKPPSPSERAVVRRCVRWRVSTHLCVKEIWTGRVTEAAVKYGDQVPMVTACCNACRTCVQTNLIGLAFASAAAAGVALRRFGRRVVAS
jgi:hypothetical protein